MANVLMMVIFLLLMVTHTRWYKNTHIQARMVMEIAAMGAQGRNTYQVMDSEMARPSPKAMLEGRAVLLSLK